VRGARKRTLITVTGRTPAFSAFADFFDGKSARVQRCAIAIREAPGGARLEIEPPEHDTIAWPLARIRRLKDMADDRRLVLRSADDDLARLLVDDAEAIAILHARCKALDRALPSEKRPRLWLWAGGAVASVALIIFVLVPLLAGQLARALPPEGEVALGNVAFEQIRAALGDGSGAPLALCETPAGIEALGLLRTRFDPGERMPYALRISVLDSPVVNAFALPGGRVALFRGLIEKAETPEEVAGVLAHEIGHVVHRDPSREALRSAGSIGVLGLLLGDFAGGTAVLFLVNRLIDASYSQDAEAAADSYAHQALVEAGVHPSALATMFERLRRDSGTGDSLLAHFQSHPQLGDRIEAARRADTLPEDAVRPLLAPGQWRALQGICAGGADGEKNRRP